MFIDKRMVYFHNKNNCLFNCLIKTLINETIKSLINQKQNPVS